ncbi:wall-associated receptor kinase-like 8 [Arachis hypogaea]|uniref:wall-associated receptor kinase-like 8 n=1 Tax=Arachis hypogaea TaxID=3818 RepID=UPI003B2176B8
MTDLRVLKKVGVVLEWEIHNSSITLPCSGYCVNTNITSAKNNHSGRRCYCRGYSDGNPYIEGGCSHVDDGYHEEDGSKKVIIGVFSSVGSVILLLCVSWPVYEVVRRRIVKNRMGKNYRKNGGVLLELKKDIFGEVNVDKVKHFTLMAIFMNICMAKMRTCQ